MAGLSRNTILNGSVKFVFTISGAMVWSKFADPVDCAISVEPRKRLIGVKLSVAFEPATPLTMTRTLLLALVGVMLTLTPVTSTKVVEVVVKLSVFIALFT